MADAEAAYGHLSRAVKKLLGISSLGQIPVEALGKPPPAAAVTPESAAACPTLQWAMQQQHQQGEAEGGFAGGAGGLSGRLASGVELWALGVLCPELARALPLEQAAALVQLVARACEVCSLSPPLSPSRFALQGLLG